MYLVAIFYSPITKSNGFAISLHFYGAAFCVNYSLPSGYLNYIPLRAYFSPVTIDRYMVLDSRLERLSPGYKSGVLPTELIQHIKLNNRLLSYRHIIVPSGLLSAPFTTVVLVYFHIIGRLLH